MGASEIALLLIVNAICFLLGFLLGRLHRAVRAKSKSLRFSNQSGGAYADIDAVIASERERINAGQACSDKSHWH